MKLCINTSCFCSPFEASSIALGEKIRLASDAGYQFIELWYREVEDYLAAGGTTAELTRMLSDHGLAVPSMITLRGWMAADPQERQAALEDCRAKLELAAALGAPRVVATPGGVRQPEWFALDIEFAAACYRDLVELGEAVGVTPMAEFLGFFSSVFQLEVAWSMVVLADHPAASLVLDPFHLWRGGSGFGRVRDVPVSQIGICHFNDAPADSPARFEQVDADRVYPGDGCLPLVGMLQTLAANGYDGALSLELFNPTHWAMPVAENIRLGMVKTKAVLDAAGL